MGWDADAMIWEEKRHESVRNDPNLASIFAAAAEEVRTLAGGVDGFLHFGSLDCSDCEWFLEQATGRDAWSGIWLPEEVRNIAASAEWPDPVTIEPGSLWAYWSARRFLDLCAEYGLAIWLEGSRPGRS
jgi:hypothetical protein